MDEIEIGKVQEQIDNFPKEWFKEGENKELIFKFVSYYLAFSSCFERYYLILDEFERNTVKNNTSSKLLKYVKSRKNDMLKLINFEDAELGVFYKFPVFIGTKKPNPKYETQYYLDNITEDGEHESEIRRFRNLFNENRGEKLKALFLTINQVRNNLFHGEKVPTSPRDIELIKASVYVLEKIKDFLIEDYCWIYSNIGKYRHHKKRRKWASWFFVLLKRWPLSTSKWTNHKS